ncbi:MAG: hypothetical protein GX652_13835 [Burkholderiaceae bacterium]|nr:hypothetical protein [Burkholderiaceae bacterium]
MRKSVAAPAVGLLMALLVAGCGGGSSDGPAPVPPPPPPPNGNQPPPPPPPPTVANSVQQVKDDMAGSHEATSPQLGASDYYANGPALRQGPPGAGRFALGGYGQIYVGSGHAAPNARVQLRNLETYAYTGGVWKRVQYSERVKGAFYSASYAGSGTTAATAIRNEPTGGVSVKLVANRLFRFWPESGLTASLVDPATVEAVFTTVQARLIQDDGTVADDASAKLLVNTAAEWRDQADFESLYAAEVPAAAKFVGNDQIGNGKLRLVTSQWQAMNFHSGSSAQADALAAGARSALANSAPLEVPSAKRFIVIGDSISEGGTSGSLNNYDSYRRGVWNGLVSRADKPLVDFVGTRRGVTSDGGDCSPAPSVTNGTPPNPEFDPDHQAYWGWCTEMVTDALSTQLQTLANAGRTPDIALVHLGTNDITQQSEMASVIRSDLDQLITALRNANTGIRILLAQIIDFNSGESDVAALNAEIASLAAQRSTAASPVSVVDQNTGFTAGDRYDGFHPNASGEAKMAARWLQALDTALP